MSTSVPDRSSKPHFSLLATSFAGGPRPRNTAIILFGIWLLLFAAALFAPPLLDDADATHAQAARAILSSGDWVTLHVDGVRYLEKAPLPYWLAAISFRIFGFNAFAAHLPQAIAILLLMLLGHRWANQAFGARTGFYTALAILTCPGAFLFTRVLIPEALLSLFLAAALFAFLRALGPIALPPNIASAPLERPSIAWHAGPLFYPFVLWSSLAFAVLAKGLVALVFFFTSALLFLLLTGTLRDVRRLRPFAGLLLFLAIAAPWHILAALRTPETSAHHGFLWFYFWNEHVLRFLGRRIPADYNRLPSYLYWTLHLVWLFPWAFFLPLGVTALFRRFGHQVGTLARFARLSGAAGIVTALVAGTVAALTHLLTGSDLFQMGLLAAIFLTFIEVLLRRGFAGLTLSPFHRIDPQQRTILLLSLFAATVLIFFSLSTNQEYYTFPAYLPILLLVAATITRAEQTFSSNPSARRWITFAHASFTLVGTIIAIALLFGLWASRSLPFLADIGTELAHRGVGGYTLSMSSLFDLTLSAFAALRLPAVLAALAFTLGPALAWMLRTQRRHLAATSAMAFTSAVFLFAAHLALVRFGPMLSSRDFASGIQRLQAAHRIGPDSEILLFGDQAFGSSLAFYLDRPVFLVNGRSSSLFFGSTFPDAPPIFLTSPQLLAGWGNGARKVVFVPIETRTQFEDLMGKQQIVLAEQSGKTLYTDRPLAP